MRAPYWLRPRYWWACIVYWAYQSGVWAYCWQHDVNDWAWRHRRCGCWRMSAAGRKWQARLTALFNRRDGS